MFGRFAAAVAHYLRPRSSVAAPSWFVDWVRDQPGLAGVAITRGNAETIAAFFQALSLISGDVAKLPLLVYRGLPSGGRSRDKEHAAAYLLRRKPSANTTAFLWRRTLARHVLLHGNGYAAIVRDPRTLAPRELLPLDPTKIQPGYDRAGRVVYRLGQLGQGRTLGQYDVFHWRVLTDDGLTGRAIVDVAKDSLALTKAAEQFGATFFGNQSIGGGVLEYPSKLDDQTIAQIRRQWELMRARENSHRIAVLQAGVKFSPISIPPEQAQFLQTREFQRQEVASWFNLPPHKLGDGSRTSFSSLEQENQSYLDSALEPYLSAAEDEAFDKLLSESEKRSGDYDVEFLRAAILKPDTATRYTTYATGISTGFLTANECRAAENLPPVEGGDVVRFPLNTSTANPSPPPAKPSDAGEPKKQRQQRRRTRRPDPAANQAQAFAALVAASVAPKIRWEAAALERLAKAPETFAAALDTFYGEHRRRMVEAVAPAVACAAATLGQSFDAPAAVERYVAESRERLAHSAGPIADVVRDWPDRAPAFAAGLLGLA